MREKRAQVSPQILASIAIAAAMLTIVATYAMAQRGLAGSEPSPVPLALRHEKYDVDSDFHNLFCDAGLCVSSSHSGEAAITFSINANSALFQNLSNFTTTYGSYFNSSRRQLLLNGLEIQLESNTIQLGETATESSFSLSDRGIMELYFQSNSTDGYNFTLGCANTSEIDWTNADGGGAGVNFSLAVPGYNENDSMDSLGFYFTSFETDCGEANISVINDSIYSNFSYQNVSLGVSLPTANPIGVFPMMIKGAIHAPGTAFSSICPTGAEPTYPPTVSNRRYGTFFIQQSSSVDSRITTNFILANGSGSFNTAYFDTNNNCIFMDPEDEYFVTTGEWIEFGGRVARLDSFTPDGSGATFLLASAGAEGNIQPARLVQPIYIDRP